VSNVEPPAVSQVEPPAVSNVEPDWEERVYTVEKAFPQIGSAMLIPYDDLMGRLKFLLEEESEKTGAEREREAWMKSKQKRRRR